MSMFMRDAQQPREHSGPAGAVPGIAALQDGASSRVPGWLVWSLVLVMAGLSAVYLGRGLHLAWTSQGGDLWDRYTEYRWFREHVYPNRQIAGPGTAAAVPWSVYPPYAFPLFAIFFEAGGFALGKALNGLLALASLGVIGGFGYRQLRFAGQPLALFGAMAGAAIAGNMTTFALGQFSMLSAGLIALQVIFLGRGQSVAAATCWTLAMIKPQIALPFAALFLLRQQWLGLAGGTALLTTLSLGACWWTGVAPASVVRSWWFGSLNWTLDSGTGPGPLALVFGISPRLAQGGALLLLLGLVLAIALRLRRQPGRPALLPLAAICALLGMMLSYHRFYDNIMLFPALVAVLVMAVRAPSWFSIGLSAGMALSVCVPASVANAVPGHASICASIWTLTAIALWLRRDLFVSAACTASIPRFGAAS